MKKIPIGMLILMALMTGVAYAGDQGRIAVASEGKDMGAQVSAVAARSPNFLMVDREGHLLEVLDNPHRDDRRGAGASVASFLEEKGVFLVMAGRFGEKMSMALTDRGIAYLAFQGRAEDAIKKALNKEDNR